jgi:hypothetical protein
MLLPQAPCRHGEVGIGEHDGGALAAQLQGHRGEVPGRGRHHQPAHPAAAGEEDVVEALLQQPGGDAAVAAYHLNDLGREGFGDRPGDQGRGAGSVLGRFEHHAVAGRQGAHQGVQAELEGVVPGTDDQHAAQGFGLLEGTAGFEGQIHRHGPRGHPAAQAPPGEPELLLHRHQLEAGLQRRFAQVCGQGLEHRRPVAFQQGGEAIELLQPPGQRPGETAAHRFAHGLDRARQQRAGGGHAAGLRAEGHPGKRQAAV